MYQMLVYNDECDPGADAPRRPPCAVFLVSEVLMYAVEHPHAVSSRKSGQHSSVESHMSERIQRMQGYLA